MLPNYDKVKGSVMARGALPLRPYAEDIEQELHPREPKSHKPHPRSETPKAQNSKPQNPKP